MRTENEMACYSDHNEDIRTRGRCDYCGGTALDDCDFTGECAFCGRDIFDGAFCDVICAGKYRLLQMQDSMFRGGR